MSFADKVVLVTGASSGIGAATAIEFAKEGAKVALVGRNEDKLQKVTDECAKTGNEALLIKADITNEEEAKRVVKVTIDKFGKINILINNAGILRFTTIFNDNVLEIYDMVMNTNLRAHIHMTHLAVPYLVKTKGNIVNVSSIAGSMPPPVQATYYALSKAALNQFTRGTALELAPHGVRVNSISPGPVITDIVENSGITKLMGDMKIDIPHESISDAREIADIILFVASDNAVAITGTDYVCDNGFTLKR